MVEIETEATLALHRLRTKLDEPEFDRAVSKLRRVCERLTDESGEQTYEAILREHEMEVLVLEALKELSERVGKNSTDLKAIVDLMYKKMIDGS